MKRIIVVIALFIVSELYAEKAIFQTGRFYEVDWDGMLGIHVCEISPINSGYYKFSFNMFFEYEGNVVTSANSYILKQGDVFELFLLADLYMVKSVIPPYVMKVVKIANNIIVLEESDAIELPQWNFQ